MRGTAEPLLGVHLDRDPDPGEEDRPALLAPRVGHVHGAGPPVALGAEGGRRPDDLVHVGCALVGSHLLSLNLKLLDASSETPKCIGKRLFLINRLLPGTQMIKIRQIIISFLVIDCFVQTS